MAEVLTSARYAPDMPSSDVLSGAAPPFRNFSPGEDSDSLISTSPSRSFDDGKFSVSVSVSPKSRRVRALPSREQEQNVNQSCGNGSSAQQLSVLALVLTTFRRSLVACRANREECPNMEISWPTNVRHVAHVTFDRYNGFLGLPVEFELEIPRRVPSASASVFGVSAESMQCSYDGKGNSVPTILLLMQERLYVQGGLKAEGIFRINPENSQEEHVRDQLNKGIVPDDIDVHCLAGLIKAWFRELPSGVLDSLTPDQVLNCNAEEEYVELVKFLPPTQVALLDWAINLMADVVQEEHHNKMNARNIAMVFAPNMTQMSDPLTALMHAVQVMNFLKTLILKTLREREEASMGHFPTHFCTDPSDEDASDVTGQTLGNCEATDSVADDEQQSGSVEFSMDDYCHSIDDDSVNEIEEGFLVHYGGKDSPDEEVLSMDSRVDDFSPSSNGDAELREKIRGRILNKFNEVSSFQLSKDASMFLTESEHEKPSAREEDSVTTSGKINNENTKNNAEVVRGDEKDHLHYMVQVNQAGMKSIGGRVMKSIEQKTERVEAWC